VAQVEKISLRTTQVRGRDNIAIIIPNSKFVNDDVINWSRIKEKTRFDIKVGVAYDSEIELVKKLIREAALENPNVAKSQEPQVRLLDYGDSALIFQLMFWGENEFRAEGVKSDIRYAILEKFRHHGVQIPFPQRVVHFEPAPPPLAVKNNDIV
jgi:small-conductance mechanosensitive channel